ncbi:substrate-binding protein [Variovorax sp. J31P207]|uniref:substrate-binding protein n=1 Tax=Variovorax sp. J31P207 TaxID=3053510 RepID=UPI002578123A|nr:substrate-binding protein [Variovorax sp. J31P207]MDM0069959.1 substrate-binding protein [Variovorax sp. J31P207]
MNKVNSQNRRSFLKRGLGLGGLLATGAGSWVVLPEWANAAEGPIKVGMPVDLTGGLGVVGAPMVNTAKLVVKQINDAGGLLGRPVQLFIEDTATNENAGVTAARKLVQRDRVDLVVGGVASSMRNAIKDSIVSRGKTLYMYPSPYEGGECTADLFCTGPTPAQQCDEFIPWLIKARGKRIAIVGSNYIWPHKVGAYAKNLIQKSGGEVVYEEFFPLDQIEFSSAVNKIRSTKTEVVFNMIIAPGGGPFFKQLYSAGFSKEGGHLACLYYDENALLSSQPAEFEGLANCLDYFRVVDAIDPTSARIQAAYEAMHGKSTRFAAGNQSTGVYRALKLWETAVKECGSVDRAVVASALDHAKLTEGPGGPCAMVPGKRHVKMNMYIAAARNGQFELIERSKGLVDPREC